MNNQNDAKYTVAGTDINDVKRKKMQRQAYLTMR